jgi:hypothetical protein
MRLYVHLNPMPNLSKRIHGKIAKTQPDLGLYNLDRAPQIGYRQREILLSRVHIASKRS